MPAGLDQQDGGDLQGKIRVTGDGMAQGGGRVRGDRALVDDDRALGGDRVLDDRVQGDGKVQDDGRVPGGMVQVHDGMGRDDRAPGDRKHDGDRACGDKVQDGVRAQDNEGQDDHKVQVHDVQGQDDHRAQGAHREQDGEQGQEHMDHDDHKVYDAQEQGHGGNLDHQIPRNHLQVLQIQDDEEQVRVRHDEAKPGLEGEVHLAQVEWGHHGALVSHDWAPEDCGAGKRGPDVGSQALEGGPHEGRGHGGGLGLAEVRGRG